MMLLDPLTAVSVKPLRLAETEDMHTHTQRRVVILRNLQDYFTVQQFYVILAALEELLQYNSEETLLGGKIRKIFFFCLWKLLRCILSSLALNCVQSVSVLSGLSYF